LRKLNTSSAEQFVQDPVGDDLVHQAGRRVRQDRHADTVVRQQHAVRDESVGPAGVHGDLVLPVAAD
jgi:hypothetical protein